MNYMYKNQRLRVGYPRNTIIASQSNSISDYINLPSFQ